MAGNLVGPDSPETKAFRAVEQVLRTDPQLKKIGVNFNTLTDDPGDVVDPSISQMPYLSLAPYAGGTGWYSEAEHESNVGVEIRLYVEGTHADDIMNFWAWVRGALFPQDPARRAVVDGLMSPLVINGQLTKQGFSGYSPDGKARALVAQGALVLRINVNT